MIGECVPFGGFANPKVVIAYCKLLSHYRTNSPATNQQVLRMLHRLAWDLQMYPMLFQASVFRTFQNIMHDCYSLPKERELARLATFVVRKFVDAAKENKIAFAELLFWKNTKDAYELVHGYGSGSKKPTKVAWTEEQVYELKVLYERYKDEVTPGESAAAAFAVPKHLSVCALRFRAFEFDTSATTVRDAIGGRVKTRCDVDICERVK
ncbi:hypothetical protein HPB50_019730 [Hyalomma asiaticum]|uniref:Uncharacterized protein n=1 Tax=Hyalomma asiaticum TaxID=266040 RepID=A0ACB7SAN5_HYAAI|nr:hypothetical protein HPB50_019730 [Hyalomma asiaticum]